MTTFTLSTKFEAIDRISSTVSRISGNVDNFARRANRSINKIGSQFDRFNDRINKTVGVSRLLATALAALAIDAGFQSAAQNVLDFDKNLLAASAKFQVFDKSSKIFIDLEKQARKVGETTQFTAGQAAEGLKNMATAGFDANQAIAGLNTVVNFATANQSDLSTASDLASKGLAAFGLMSKDPLVLSKNLESLTGSITKIVNETGFANLDQIAITLGNSATVANLAGLSISQWGSLVGTATKKGIDFSSAGTNIATSLTRILAPAKEGQKAMRAIGLVPVKDGKFRNILDIIEDIQKAIAGLSDAKRVQILKDIFGQEALKTITAIIDTPIEELRRLNLSFENSTGVVTRSAQFMNSGISGLAASLNSSLQEIQLSISSTFQTEIDKSIKNIIEIARETGTWIKENKNLILTVGNILVKIAAFLAFIKVITFALKAYRTVVIALNVVKAFFAGINLVANKRLLVQKFLLKGNTKAIVANRIAIKAGALVMGLLNNTLKIIRVSFIAFNAVVAANPIGAIILAIAALIAGIVALIYYWDEIKNTMDRWSKSAIFQIVKVFVPIVALIDFIQFIQDRWEGLIKVFKGEGIISGIKAIGKALLSFFLEPVEKILKGLGSFFGFDWVVTLGNDLASYRRSLDFGLVKPPEVDAISGTPSSIPAIDNTVTQEQLRTERQERIEASRLDINIQDETGRASVDSKGLPIPFNLVSTVGGF